MSLLALLAAHAATGPVDPGDPDPPPVPDLTVPTSTLHSLTGDVLDWGQAQTLVLLSQFPAANDLREQDDIIYDPGATDPNRRWCFYFSVSYGATSRVFVIHSADGEEWTNPVQCFNDGQDPSITQTWEPDPVAYRDGLGRLILFCENNGTSDIDAWASVDGTTWEKIQGGAIVRSAGWDHSLVGSPNARHDGTRFIVGYEGIRTSPSRIETFSLAWGGTPSTLVKSPNNPIVDPTTQGLHDSIVSDALYLSPAGDRVFLGAHSGLSAAQNMTMWRMTTTKTDPTTWTTGDFTTVGGMADPTRRGDFTIDAYRGMVVTTPEGRQSMVRLPLVPPT